MILRRVIIVLCIGSSLYLAYYLYASVQGVIDSRTSIKRQERVVIEKLKLIREAEILFQSYYGNYTANWDSLIYFIKNVRIPIVERREEIVQKEYGQEEVIVHTDTLRFVPAWDQLFKQEFTMAATEYGIFDGFLVKKGGKVLKNQRAYRIKVGEKKFSPPFTEEGTISKLASIAVGDSIEKGQLLVTFWKYTFSPDEDIDRIAYKPNADVPFDIFVESVDRNGLPVSVIEVKDPSPDNPLRVESNKLTHQKPLRFGSRIDATLSGNWE